jgi:hypothetical protein
VENHIRSAKLSEICTCGVSTLSNSMTMSGDLNINGVGVQSVLASWKAFGRSHSLYGIYSRIPQAVLSVDHDCIW